MSRTFAVIKPPSLQYRLNIESLLSEAGFEIIKERQLLFHPDDEALPELFGKQAHSLKGGAVWVYVLEKQNAVEDLQMFIGDEDPEVARLNAPNSIRALYGKSLDDNVLYAAPDPDAAELQISSIFASSPPFPPTEASPIDEELSPLPDASFSPRRRVSSDESDLSSSTGRALKSNPQFRARPIPATTAVPSIQPRSTRAAALRAGLAVAPSPPKTRGPLSKEALAKTFANVPGHKRAETIAVASTAPPAIAPRATRASLLRTGQAATKPVSRPRASTTLTQDTPGYKRQLNITVASTAPPAIQPRQTRASTLRTGQSGPPKKTSRPSTANERQGASSNTFEGVAGHRRSESIPVASTRPPATAPRLNRSATLRARGQSNSGNTPPSSFKDRGSAEPEEPNKPRTLSTQSSRSSLSGHAARPSVSRGRSGAPPSSFVSPVSASDAPPRPPSVARAPSIEPRTNRSAMLRARAGTPTASKSSAPKFVMV